MILNENNPSLEDNIIILKTFLYKLKRLKNLKLEIEIKRNVDEVLSNHKPLIFWKEKDIIKKHLNLWNLEQIQNLIVEVNDLEMLIKKNSQISSFLTNNFILEKITAANS